MKTISQREAHRLRKRVSELEHEDHRRLSRWSSDYPGVLLGTLAVSLSDWQIIRVARALGHAVVLTTDTEGTLRIYGSPP